MEVGRFFGGIAALIWSPRSDNYLLLKRSGDKDFASGVWECVTGRLNQGEGFEDAIQREVLEELGVEVELEYFLGTTHFYRGARQPDNELVGIVACCWLDDTQPIQISEEHSEYRWVSAAQAFKLLSAEDSSTSWMRRVLQRAEEMKSLVPPQLRDYYRQRGFELG
ncbi:MAG: NUDIX domain-containing protein [Anaerolineales bacterium]